MEVNDSFDIDKIVIWILLIILPIFLFFVSFLLGRYPVAPVDVVKTVQQDTYLIKMIQKTGI